MSDAHSPFGEDSVDPDPVAQFALWFSEARASGLREPEAVALGTASASGQPAVRMVLLKSFDQRGFVFYSHYNGRKGREIDENPLAAMTVHWAALGRQVRIEGPVEHTSAEESAEYVRSRSRESQLGALASRQSEVIRGREELELSVARIERENAGHELPLPEHWGGFRVVPADIEFWQQRASRMHDRLRYRREQGGWVIERLAP